MGELHSAVIQVVHPRFEAPETTNFCGSVPVVFLVKCCTASDFIPEKSCTIGLVGSEAVFFLVVLKPEKTYFFRVCESRKKVQTLKKQKIHGMSSGNSQNRCFHLALSKLKMVQ